MDNYKIQLIIMIDNDESIERMKYLDKLSPGLNNIYSYSCTVPLCTEHSSWSWELSVGPNSSSSGRGPFTS